MLEPLQTFTLFFIQFEIKVSFGINASNVFKYVTGFTFHEPETPALQHALDNFHYCQNLESFQIIKTEKILPEDEALLDFTPLQRLKDLKKLKTIDLSINLNIPSHLENFLRSFSIPKSITSIKLNFYETSWSHISSDIKSFNLKTNNIFKEHDTYIQFYQNWENLDKLESLSLSFTETDNYLSMPSLFFMTPLLERLSNLSMLHYVNCCETEDEKRKALDFSYLLEALDHLKSKLKKLYIESYAISIRNMKLNKADNLGLEELGLCGLVLGDTNVHSLINLLPKSKHCYSRSKPSLELDRLVIDNEESFLSFMEDIQRTSKRLNVSLYIDARKMNSKRFAQQMCEIIPKLTKKSSMSLTFVGVPPMNTETLKELNLMLCQHKVFKNITLLDQFENEIFNSEEGSVYMPSNDKYDDFFERDRMLEVEEDDRPENYDASSGSSNDMSSEGDGVGDFIFDTSPFTDQFDNIEEDI